MSRNELIARLRDNAQGEGLAIFDEAADALEAPIDMILHCPACLEQHIDAATETWPNEPHRSHLCQHCGFIWRPCDLATNGVAEIKTRGKDDMVMFDGPLEVLRRLRAAEQPKLEWGGEQP